MGKVLDIFIDEDGLWSIPPLCTKDDCECENLSTSNYGNKYCLDCGYEVEQIKRCNMLTQFTPKNQHGIGLKEIKFCKFCGSKNIVQSNGFYQHYNCLECGTQRID